MGVWISSALPRSRVGQGQLSSREAVCVLVEHSRKKSPGRKDSRQSVCCLDFVYIVVSSASAQPWFSLRIVRCISFDPPPSLTQSPDRARCWSGDLRFRELPDPTPVALQVHQTPPLVAAGEGYNRTFPSPVHKDADGFPSYPGASRREIAVGHLQQLVEARLLLVPGEGSAWIRVCPTRGEK